MIRAVIVSPDRELGECLENQLLGLGDVGIARRLDCYPSSLELIRFLRAHAPQVVFLSIESLGKAFDIVAGIEAHTPGVQIVAVHRVTDPQTLLELMRAGIREFVSFPFEQEQLAQVLRRLGNLLEKKPPSDGATDQMFTFLPSKPGVGTSTIAMNAAAALSRADGNHVLLIDMDLNSGMLRFMLKLDNPYSVTDACENAMRMDETLWPRMITSLDTLDVVHAGKLNLDTRIEAPQVRHLIEFARRNYKAICVDLSGNLEKYSVELMHESRRIFLVCTPETPSLHLAREKYAYLKSLDLADRVSVLLNREHRRALISTAQIEDLLGIPILMSFPNDYHGVHKALAAGHYVDKATELGKRFVLLAKAMLERDAPPAAEHKKRFVEYFSIMPARYQLFPETKRPAV